jgi:hypothetical protein
LRLLDIDHLRLWKTAKVLEKRHAVISQQGKGRATVEADQFQIAGVVLRIVEGAV